MDLSEELFQAFDGLTCRLSPENLSCDGECTIQQTRNRFAEIRREWKALEKQAGRAVSQDEIENESFKRITESRARV